MSLALQRRMHGALPCEDVIAIDASHSAYFSKPDELASAIVRLGGDG